MGKKSDIIVHMSNPFENPNQEIPQQELSSEASNEWTRDNYELKIKELDSQYDEATGESLYAFTVGDGELIAEGLNKGHEALIQRKNAQLDRLKNDTEYIKLLKERIPSFSIEGAEEDARKNIEWLNFKKEAANKHPEFQALVELSSPGEELIADSNAMGARLLNKARVMAKAQEEWIDPAQGRDYRARDYVAAEGFAQKAAEKGNTELAIKMIQSLQQIDAERLSQKSRDILERSR